VTFNENTTTATGEKPDTFSRPSGCPLKAFRPFARCFRKAVGRDNVVQSRIPMTTHRKHLIQCNRDPQIVVK